MRTILALLLLGLIGLGAAHMHENDGQDSSEEDRECECRHHDGPPPPHDDMAVPEAEEHLTEEEKQKMMEERHRKHMENERCCRKHWQKKHKIIIIAAPIAGAVVVIAVVIIGCCCYHKKCKKSRTNPDLYKSPVFDNRYGLSAELGYVKEPLPEGDVVVTGNVPPAYTTVPMYGGGPGELILTAPPAYATREKKTALQ